MATYTQEGIEIAPVEIGAQYTPGYSGVTAPEEMTTITVQAGFDWKFWLAIGVAGWLLWRSIGHAALLPTAPRTSRRMR